MNAAVFHQAVADGDATRVKFLINIGQQARVNQRNKQGYTSLQQSCKDGRYEVADVLLSHGANITTTDKKGRSALHLASAGGYADIVKLLIASYADINAKDNDGKLAIDVAKTSEITALLTKASEEKQAKNPESNKKGIPEDWSQNVTSLPAGSRNSLVSNSSSDSGVFIEENSVVRNGDYSTTAKFVRSNGYAPFRGSTNADSRVMGVLNESDEHLHDCGGGRERSRTVHEIGNSVQSTDNIYEQTRERSNTFESHARTLHERSQYDHLNPRISNGINLYEIGNDRTSNETPQYELQSHLNAGNSHERNQHETGHLGVQTSMKMQHNANPQPKLRRSMSERLPPRQRKQLNGRRDISEELSALNLSRAMAREQPQNGYYYDNTSERRDLRSQNLACIPEPISPNEDLGYGGESFEIPNDFSEFGRSSERKYYPNGSMSLPRNRSRRAEFYPAHDEGWEEGQGEECVCGGPQNRSNLSVASNGIDYLDDVELYRRNQLKNLRSWGRQMIEGCRVSSVEDGYLATGDRSRAYSNNESMQNFPQQASPPRCMTPQNNRFDSRDFDEALLNNNVTLRRNNSACSDTAVGSYHRRMLQNGNDYIDYNGNCDYYYEHTRAGLPSYEDTLKRLGSEPAAPPTRRHASISQV